MALLVIELPFNYKFKHSQGVHLVKDGGLYNDTYEIETDKVEIDRWVEIRESVHNCVSNGDCYRCEMNDRMEYHYISFRTDRGEFTFVKHISDTIGSVFTDYAMA